MLEKLNVFKGIADWYLKLSINAKYNLLLTVIICVLGYRNYANTELSRKALQIKDNRIDECIRRLDSLNMLCSEKILHLQEKSYSDQVAMYKRFEEKYKELYEATRQTIKKHKTHEDNRINTVACN